MRPQVLVFVSLMVLLCGTGCYKVRDIIDDLNEGHEPQATEFATGLTAPLGLEADEKGQLWVTEAGSGLGNDAQLSMITPQGKVYPVVKGFTSLASPEGAVFGLNHLVLDRGTLWMLHGVEGRLYKFDISSYKPGDAPLQASQLEYEDIGSFVKDYVFEDDTDGTDVFNLAVGPDGDLFIADAGANAIIRRKSGTGKLSVFAKIPRVKNPGGDPAEVEAVPTGIVFDGHQFFVCTFTGYPYPSGQATIYRVDLNGNTSVYQAGLHTLTDIELGSDQKPVVLEYGTWTGETFETNSGRMLRSTPGNNKPLFTNLNFPNSIKRTGLKTYYVAETFDGRIRKIIL